MGKKHKEQPFWTIDTGGTQMEEQNHIWIPTIERRHTRNRLMLANKTAGSVRDTEKVDKDLMKGVLT